MLDLKRTLELVRGALLDPEPTWRAYRAEAGDWRRTVLLLTGPLLVASAVLAWAFGYLQADTSMLAPLRPTPGTVVVNILTGAISAAVAAVVFAWVAGVTGGNNDIPLALAATTLAFVPAYLGEALAWFPWIGWIIALGLLVWSLVLLWRILPLYLAVPEEKRVLHYVLSLATVIVLVYILSRLVNAIFYGGAAVPSAA